MLWKTYVGSVGNGSLVSLKTAPPLLASPGGPGRRSNQPTFAKMYRKPPARLLERDPLVRVVDPVAEDPPVARELLRLEDVIADEGERVLVDPHVTVHRAHTWGREHVDAVEDVLDHVAADHDLSGNVEAPEEVPVQLAAREGRHVDILPDHAVPERRVAGPGAALCDDPPRAFSARIDGVGPAVEVEVAQDDLARISDVHGGRPDVLDREVVEDDSPAVEDLDERVAAPVDLLVVGRTHEVAAAVEGHAALAADHDGSIEAPVLVRDFDRIGVHAAQ